jgi:hypothetical protein
MHVMGCVVQIAAEVSTWQSLSEHQKSDSFLFILKQICLQRYHVQPPFRSSLSSVNVDLHSLRFTLYDKLSKRKLQFMALISHECNSAALQYENE